LNEISPKLKRRIKKLLSGEKPTVRIGKAKISGNLLSEIERQLKDKEMVKVKMLKSSLQGLNAKSVASEIAEKTDSNLIEVRGHTFILYKRRKN